MGKYQQHLLNVYQIPVQRALLDLCPRGHSPRTVPECAETSNCTLSPKGSPWLTTEGSQGRVKGKYPSSLTLWQGHGLPRFPESPWGPVLQVPRYNLIHDTRSAGCLPSPASPSYSPGSASWDHLQINLLYLHLCFWGSQHKATRCCVYRLYVYLCPLSQ